MPKAHQKWIVLPHGRIREIDKNILTVVGDLKMPLATLPRRMTIARLADARLVVFSAIALDESAMRVVEDFGKPAFLVVPSAIHRLDAKAWKARYPQMQVVAPEGARKEVEEVVPVDATQPRFDDFNVHFVTMPGTEAREAALEIHSPQGATIVVNDLIGNIRKSKGFGGWFLRLMKFAGDEPHVPRPVKRKLVKDPAALAAQFTQWAQLPSLKRILVSHGDPIEYQPAEALRDLAHSLTYDGQVHGRAEAA